jgi:hypothetical protein
LSDGKAARFHCSVFVPARHLALTIEKNLPRASNFSLCCGSWSFPGVSNIDQPGIQY